MTAQEIQKMVDDAIKADRLSQEAKFDQDLEAKYQAKFKEQFGTDPKTFLANLEQSKVQKFAERKKAITDSLKTKYGMAPKIVDGFLSPIIDAMGGIEDQSIKFAETESGDIFKLLDKFGETMAKGFEEDTLFVDLGEYAKFGGDEDNPNLGKNPLSDREKLHKAIIKFQIDNKIESFGEATEKYMALNK